uniref:NADH-ubiquinone oxidoreductase chain 2 n=1 Tax=Hemicentetes semispinosus TaxID=319813 RepID=A0A165QSA9_9EUTH|nr:NADH dehydrogenase subunit 2 [Hemicentetes semispinosus]
MNPLASILIYSTLIMGTLITMMSSHWILAWMGLEMNMFAIIPLIMKTHSPRTIEATTKYFLTQALASMLFLMAITLNYLYAGHWMLTNMNNSMAETLAMTAVMMKLGMTPFHFWVPEVIQGTTLKSSLIILTWQKIAPLTILYQLTLSINSTIILMSAILSIMIGGWGGLNQTQIRKILAYSSISHMGWMAIIIMYNPSLTMLNLLLYILFTFSAFIILINCFSTSTTSLAMASNNSPMLMFLLSNVLLSMGGLPPLTGFSPKWLIINELIKNNTTILALTISILTLLNLYFYLRIIYLSSMTMFPTNNNLKLKWKVYFSYKLILLPTIVSISIFSLPLTPLMLMME